MLRIFLPTVFLLQPTSAASLHYSYLGIAESTDFFGNPVFVSRGEYEIGELSFDESIPLPSVLGVSSFSFTTFTLGSDSFGNPSLHLIEFSNDDVTFLDASFSGGRFEAFELVAEVSAKDSPDEIFRFTVESNLRGRLEKVASGSEILISEGAVAIIPEPTSALLYSLSLLAFFRRSR